MSIQQIITCQFGATLAMLQECIVKCPESLWYSTELPNRYWQVAYHALFYTHLYLQPSEFDFSPWAKHRADHESLGALPPLGTQSSAPYTREEMIDYLAFCQNEVATKVDELEGDSGFSWLPFAKLELHIYNIRHLQQHVGELSGRLAADAQIDIDWVGTKPA